MKQVFALAHKNIRNTILVQQGDYHVSAQANTKGALYVPSNTTVEVDGIITLVANDFPGCAVMYIKNANNIIIKGTGKIVGDNDTHKGTQGEWGMGIQIMHGRNIDIHNLDISNCWGDCVYVGDNSYNVVISNCMLHHARRQGISITYAKKVTINKCIIHDIGGTAPEYAIDFEPNAKDIPRNSIIGKAFRLGQRAWNSFAKKWKGPEFYSILKIDYKSVVQKALRLYESQNDRHYPTVFPNWDNSPRRKAAVIIQNDSPDDFAQWVHSATDILRKRPEEDQFLFINAWNEWAEGAHLEPDQEMGRSFLEAFKKGIEP